MAEVNVYLVFLSRAVFMLLRQFLFLIYPDGCIPCPGFFVQWLLQLSFGDDKLKKLEYLTEFYHKYGVYTFDKKIYIFDQKLAQTAINKLEKGAENYLEDSPLKDTFLGSSSKSPETRRAIAAIFRKTSIEEKSNIMIQDIDKICAKMAKEGRNGVNITDWSLCMALDIVGHVLLQLDFNALDRQQDRILECMMTILHRCYALGEITPNSSEFKKANEDFDKLTSKVLENALNIEDLPNEEKRLVKKLHEACGFEQAKDNMKLFLMAGTETTASTIPVIFYLLTKYPDVQEELRQEADELVDLVRKDPTVPLPKIESMMREVLRLYPIAPFISRQNQHPVTLGKLNLDQHSDIIVFTWGIHRSSHYWENSKEFKPFRSLDKDESILSSNLFIPFGAGSRVCIGQHLAWLELRLVVAILLNRFIFEKIPETPELKIVCDWAHAVVHPDKDMVFKLISRK